MNIIRRGLIISCEMEDKSCEAVINMEDAEDDFYVSSCCGKVHQLEPGETIRDVLGLEEENKENKQVVIEQCRYGTLFFESIKSVRHFDEKIMWILSNILKTVGKQIEEFDEVSLRYFTFKCDCLQDIFMVQELLRKYGCIGAAQPSRISCKDDHITVSYSHTLYV